MIAGPQKYFGTDGIRGETGRLPMTADFVLKLGWAVGTVLAGGGSGTVVIGKDTRVSGYMFESALAAGFTAAGIDVMLLGLMPTPAVAYLTRALRATAGIVISASHNPYFDNGIKCIAGDGGKLCDAVELEIESMLDATMHTVATVDVGKMIKTEDVVGRYIEFCKSTALPDSNLHKLRIVVDCAHGATCHIGPRVFAELGAAVIPIGCAPDGLNINDGFGVVAPDALCKAVRDHGADLGIAFDGDGDRVLMVDATGEVVDGDELLFIIAKARHDNGRLTGSVVGTVMTNLGLEDALHARGIKLHRAQVGDRNVLTLMRRHGCIVGGEPSGHIICCDYTTIGDGIVTAIQVLNALVQFSQPLCEAKRGMAKYPQVLRNIRITKQIDSAADTALQDAAATIGEKLGNRGRVLLRASGTEPIVRVMVEGIERAEVERCADQLTAIATAKLTE